MLSGSNAFYDRVLVTHCQLGRAPVGKSRKLVYSLIVVAVLSTAMVVTSQSIAPPVVAAAETKAAVGVTSSAGSMCAVTDEEEVYCWGHSNDGLGDGVTGGGRQTDPIRLSLSQSRTCSQLLLFLLTAVSTPLGSFIAGATPHKALVATHGCTKPQYGDRRYPGSMVLSKQRSSVVDALSS